MENKNIIKEEILFDLAELFKIFGDSTRIKILYELFDKELNLLSQEIYLIMFGIIRQSLI